MTQISLGDPHNKSIDGRLTGDHCCISKPIIFDYYD